VVETMFGYVERRGEVNPPMGVIDMQRALRHGFHYENALVARLDSIEALLNDRLAVASKQPPRRLSDEMTTRVQQSLEEHTVLDERVMVVVIYPDSPGQLKTIFLTDQQSIRAKLENPPVLRYAGWDIETGERAQIVRGALVRIGRPGARKLLELHRDGTLLFAAPADDNFLAWGASNGRQRINSLALIESIYSVCRFYELVLSDLEVSPETVAVRVHMRNLHKNGIRTYLVPWAPGTYSFMLDDNRREAPKDEVTMEALFTAANFDAGAAAYGIVREIYLWFGFEEDKIPYAKEESGRTVIDTAAIIAKGK
jgi:hypothetical protein